MAQAQQGTKAPLHIPNAIVLTLTPILALIFVPLYAFTVGFDAFEWAMFAVYMICTGLAITAGYHRLWSHKSYEAHPVLRVFWAVWGACALQNSILHWASDHRRHHLHVDDNDRDPYSARRGFWFSHIGWILRKYPSGKDDFSNVKDLERDPVVQWQHKYYVPLAIGMNIAVPLAIGYLYGSLWGTFLLAGLLRLVLNHHFTFFINSLAHIWGSQHYSDENTARDNGFIAFLTYGEGYHNYHHRFQYDYRNGPRWWHFDPSKWLIKVGSYIGLTSRLKSPSRDQIEKARLSREYQFALDAIQRLRHGAEEWREQVEKTYSRVLLALEECNKVKKQARQLHKSGVARSERLDIRKQYEEHYNRFKLRRRDWRALIADLA